MNEFLYIKIINLLAPYWIGGRILLPPHHNNTETCLKSTWIKLKPIPFDDSLSFVLN